MNIIINKRSLSLLLIILSLILTEVCHAKNTGLSVSVGPNPVRDLADRIKETRSQLTQKKKEYREINNSNARLFLYFLGGILLIILGGEIYKSFLQSLEKKRDC